ncbi:MAG: hydrogenase expression/formation protein HypE [Anaerolineales bacterium]
MGHGSGGKLSHDLISQLFIPPFDNPTLHAGNDAGVVKINDQMRLAISTDSHVVWPLFFPGGDIGRLAVCGTVNDVSMMGASPMYLSAGYILEEGLDLTLLHKVVQSMQEAAIEAGVQIIAGDTKVVQKGKADLLYINTTGVGILDNELSIHGANAHPSDVVIISGPIGDHGIAVLSARGDLGFEVDISSDIAPLNHLVQAMISIDNSFEDTESTRRNSPIHVLRDPTRGGLATSLIEIARQSQVNILLDESKLPVRPPVAAACEMLGFDPLYIANEGKLVAIVQREFADEVLEKMKNTRYGEEAEIIGEVRSDPKGRVLMKTIIGSTRVVEVLSGELLPRIC